MTPTVAVGTSSPMPLATISMPAVWKWMAAFAVAQWVAVPDPSREMFITLGLFVVFDIITGLWAALVEKGVSSEIGFRGISRKLAVFPFLMFCHLMETRLHLELHLEFGGAIGYAFNEGVSIIENFARIGLPIPAKAIEALLVVKKLRFQHATREQLRELADDKGDTK